MPTVLVSRPQSSPAAQVFAERIDLWVKKLTAMQDIFDAWLMAQVRALLGLGAPRRAAPQQRSCPVDVNKCGA